MNHEIGPEDLSLIKRLARNDDEESSMNEALVHIAAKFDGRGTWEGFATQRLKWAAVDEYRNRHRKHVENARVMPVDFDQQAPAYYAPPALPGAVVRAAGDDLNFLLDSTSDKRSSRYRAAIRRIRGEVAE